MTLFSCPIVFISNLNNCKRHYWRQNSLWFVVMCLSKYRNIFYMYLWVFWLRCLKTQSQEPHKRITLYSTQVIVGWILIVRCFVEFCFQNSQWKLAWRKLVVHKSLDLWTTCGCHHDLILAEWHCNYAVTTIAELYFFNRIIVSEVENGKSLGTFKG